MALDLHKAYAQIEAAIRDAHIAQDDRRARLRELLARLAQPGLGAAVNAKYEASRGQYGYLPAGAAEEPSTTHATPPLPGSFAVAATDGSHIAVDRHLALRAYLINIGGCLLTYGASPDAYLFSQPTVYARDEDLYYTDPASSADQTPVEGAVLGFKRAVEELRALAELVRRAPERMPELALLDGSLILWGLAGQQFKPFLREAVIERGLVPALDALREESARRPLAVASYVSLPGSTEVVNALRLAFCPYDVSDCRARCGSLRPGARPCDTVHGFNDRHLFEALMGEGERSALFLTRSSVVRDHYGPHQVFFYYLNAGVEVGRVEVPEWVARDRSLLELSHALVLDQCRRGQGYPPAISESHEQAVVTAADRELFRTLVEQALQGERLPVYTSEKDRSKRMRWL